MNHVISQFMDATFYELCRGIDTPKSLAAWLLYFHKEHLQLVQLQTRPIDYLESQSTRFRDDYLVTEYLSKSEFLLTGIDRDRVATSAFHSAEAACARTNARIRHFLNSNGRENPHLFNRVISLAQMKIQDCIGTHVPWHRLLTGFKWGKGSTFSVKGCEVRIDDKLCEKQISVTHEALPLLRAAMATDYAWLRARGLSEVAGPVSLLDTEFSVVRGSRGLVVPKNAKTSRFIAAEPSGNIFLQLGIGAELRACLKRVGISLNDQSVNQALAKHALRDGLATVDLSQASDTICRELVWLLLPLNWASILDATRSPEVYFDGQWHMLSKFSSMGNGFTFELETLIFWALTESLRDATGERGRVSVYGDDIICPSALQAELPTLLAWAGFSTNVKKSHFGGVFRESCGKHYFNDLDVTPVYQKTLPIGQEIYRMVNRLTYHAIDRGYTIGETLFADSKLRFAVRLPSRFSDSGKRRLIPLRSDVSERSLDGGFAAGYTPHYFQYNPLTRSYSYKAWVFMPNELKANEGAVLAVRLRSWTSEHDRRMAALSLTVKSHYLWWVRKQLLRLDTEPLPFTGTVTRRNEGTWRLGKRHSPEACRLQWV